MERLILFDIDGTLLTTHGAAARAFRRALVEVFGTEGPLEGRSFAGKTDPQIAHELLSAAGLGEAEIESGLPELWRRYLAHFEAEIPEATIQVFQGVETVLDRLKDTPEEGMLGLLTGNLQEGARLKIDSAGLGFDRFRVGAYGSDHARREELPAVAIRRAAEACGRDFAGKQVVIIGDTPADIACGEHLGVRTIAVATGNYSREELADCGPDHLFPDLSDVDAVWEAIFGD